MNAILNWWHARPLRLRVLVVAGLAVLLLVLAGGLGSRLFPRTITTTDTATAEQLKKAREEVSSLTEDLARTQNQLLDLQRSQVVTEDVTKKPDGTVHTHKVTRTQTNEKKTTTQTETKHATEEKKVDESALRNTETKTHTVVQALSDPRFIASLGLGVQPFKGGALVALLTLDVRVVGPVYVGAWVTVPINEPLSLTVGLSAGVRFGN